MPEILSRLSKDELSHILFATDAPWGSFPSEYWKMEDLDVSATVKQAFFYENAKKLYKL